jgi:hypothetical protein
MPDITVLPLATVTLAQVMQQVATRVAELSVDAKAVLIGPMSMLRDGEIGAHVIFSHPEKSAGTSWVSLGELPPPGTGPKTIPHRGLEIMRKDLRRAMRERFDEVRIFRTIPELADAAVKRWPCTQTIAFKGRPGATSDAVQIFTEH